MSKQKVDHFAPLEVTLTWGPWSQWHESNDSKSRRRNLLLGVAPIAELTQYVTTTSHLWGAGRFFTFRYSHENTAESHRQLAKALRRLKDLSTYTEVGE